jgi:Zn finger protein HypA/HybF involved in hydrogenase expression
MALEQSPANETPAPGECALPGNDSAGEYWRWCPRCGHELHNEKCKLRCPRCHYFMSCSDFD